MAHRGGFTASTLDSQLAAAGFKMIGIGTRHEGAINLWALASKVVVEAGTFTTMMKKFFIQF